MTDKPRTVAVLALIERGPRSRLVVELREAAGVRYLTIARLALAEDGSWSEVRSVAVQLEDVPRVADALLRGLPAPMLDALMASRLQGCTCDPKITLQSIAGGATYAEVAHTLDCAHPSQKRCSDA